MSVIGKHTTTPERGYSVHRLMGLLTITGTTSFGIAILATAGSIVGNRGFEPMLDTADLATGGHGFVLLGAALILSGVLGIIGLAFDDNDVHLWPRIVTLTSAGIGVLWFGLCGFGFGYAWVALDYDNSGLFLAVPGALLHLQRLYLLSEIPRPPGVLLTAEAWAEYERAVRGDEHPER